MADPNINKRLSVSEIDFEDIKSNLKSYLRDQDEFRDYDFEGSALGTLVDILAYATHYNAVNANLGINETFLDTAQFRGSVVGHARQLGYTPKSSSAPTAVVDITVNNPSSQSLTLPKGFRLKSKIGNTTYNFVTDQEYSTSNAVFESVSILEGSVKTVEYLYDVRGNEKILIPDRNADTSTLLVEVFDSPTSSTYDVYTPAKEITSISAESEIYFISENPDGLYEVTFGDGVIGKALQNNNLVRIEYISTNREEANGARVFTTTESIEGNSNLTITTTQPARGGEGKERIDEIRFNAPLTFASQNRAVTPQDFEAIIRENFSNLDSVNVWGGEDNDPPVYGKVFISVKPQNSDLLSRAERDQILNDIVGPKTVVTITPEIVDPTFTHIALDIFFKYDPTGTELTETQLESAVKNTIDTYNENTLNSFGSVFRNSIVLGNIDDTSEGILNSVMRVYVKKRFEPILSTPNRYILDFSAPLYETQSQESVIRSSTLFTINNQSCRLKDRLTKDGNRVVQIVTGEDVNEVVVIADAGRIEGSRVILENFAPTNFQGSYIEVEAIPNSNDIAPKLNDILTIDMNDVNVTGEVDTIVAGQDFSGVRYSTTPRHD